MDKKRSLRSGTAVVKNGLIVRISKGKKSPKDAFKIDEAGEVGLAPGFVEKHTCLFWDCEFQDTLAEDELKPMLANGVTTNRIMIGTSEHIKLVEQSAEGEILAPIVYSESPQFVERSFGKIYNDCVVMNEKQVGNSVRKGKIADLVARDGNSLVNISNTKKIAGVMVRGNWLPKGKTDKILGEIVPKFQTALDKNNKKENGKVEQFGKDIFAGNVFRGSFAPDGKTFYFFKKITRGKEDYRIFTSNLVEGKWSEPAVLNLGGEYSDLYPTISKDGQRLVFSSYRPAPNDTSKKPNAHLWYVDRKADGWGKPVFLAKANKLGYYHAWVEFGWNGDIYFRQITPDYKGIKNLITHWNGKEFTEPVLFEEATRWKSPNPNMRIRGGSPGPTKDIMFFDVVTRNPKTRRNGADIWVSFKKKGKWTEPKPFGTDINKEGFDVFPFFSPDGKTLYFVRNFRTFHKISLKAAIDSIKTQE